MNAHVEENVAVHLHGKSHIFCLTNTLVVLQTHTANTWSAENHKAAISISE